MNVVKESMNVVKEFLRVVVSVLESPGVVHVFLIHQFLKLMVVHSHTGTVSSPFCFSISHWKRTTITCVYINVIIPNLESCRLELFKKGFKGCT